MNKPTIIDRLVCIPIFLKAYLNLLQKYNTVKCNYNLLQESIKNNMFNRFMEYTNVPPRLEYLEKENKVLRMKVKSLKEELREKSKDKSDKLKKEKEIKK